MKPRHWGARALVVALHAGLLTALWVQRPVARQPTPSLTQVRLIPLSPPPTALPRPARPAVPPRSVPAPRPVAPPPAPDTPSPAAEAAAAPLPAAAPALATAVPPEGARTTLRLSLPPGAASAPRNPALSDPRANTHRLTFEEKIAQAMGGEHWEEERMGDGRTLFRRGDTCFNVYTSRIANIDPMNESAKPTLKTMGAPYKCR